MHRLVLGTRLSVSPATTTRNVQMPDITEKEYLAHQEHKDLKDFRGTDRVALEAYFGVPADHLDRKVQIYKNPKSSTQHGWGSSRFWLMRFKPGPKWTNPLMGWTSSNDPMDALSIRFDSKDAALKFAADCGFDAEVSDDEHRLRRNERSYASKFKFQPTQQRFDEVDLQ